MRVAVWHNLPSGGGQRALYDHVSGLLCRGHTVEIWSPPGADRTMLDVNGLAPYHPVPLRRPKLTRRHLPPALRPALAEFSLAAMHEHCQAAGEQISSGPFDVLLSGSCAQFGAPLIGRYTKIPSVLYLQEPHRLLYEAPNLWGLPRSPARPGALLMKAVDVAAVGHARRQVAEERASASAFDVILVNSYFSAESVARAYNLASRVCYLGVDARRWSTTRRSPDGYTAVGIGSIAPHKRVEFVVEALARSGLPGCRLHWIGNEVHRPYAAQLQAQADRSGVRLSLHVALSHAEMLNVIAQASLLAYAPHLEPFGFAPLECGAAGLPTVAVAEGGVRETVQDGVNGLLTQRDAADMGRAIAGLMKDGPRREALGAAAQDIVRRHWSLDAALDRLEGELARAVGRPLRPATR